MGLYSTIVEYVRKTALPSLRNGFKESTKWSVAVSPNGHPDHSSNNTESGVATAGPYRGHAKVCNKKAGLLIFAALSDKSENAIYFFVIAYVCKLKKRLCILLVKCTVS